VPHFYSLATPLSLALTLLVSAEEPNPIENLAWQSDGQGKLAKLLSQLQQNDERSNEARRAAGYGELNTVGWAVEPNYNEEAQTLEWGVEIEDPSSGSRSVNFLTKKLGRHGVMDVTVVSDPEDLQSVLPEARNILNGFTYNAGKTYAEHAPGDKIAEYGLTALIAGGAAYGAAKLGFFAALKKFAKFIIIGVVAVGAAIKKFFIGSGRKDA